MAKSAGRDGPLVTDKKTALTPMGCIMSKLSFRRCWLQPPTRLDGTSFTGLEDTQSEMMLMSSLKARRECRTAVYSLWMSSVKRPWKTWACRPTHHTTGVLSIGCPKVRSPPQDSTNRTLIWYAALAASATNGNAYVYLRSVCGRTIFSPPSQNPQDHDPDHNNEATNGEIWYYAELPALMRNLNINKIYTFYKPEGSRKFVVNLAWDAENVSRHARLAPTSDHWYLTFVNCIARTIFPDILQRPCNGCGSNCLTR